MKDFILCLCLFAMVVLHSVTLVRVDKLEKRVSSLGAYLDTQVISTNRLDAINALPIIAY